METQKQAGPRTLRGTYESIKRDRSMAVPTLKGLARSIVKAGPAAWPKAVVTDATRWLATKSGGTAEERKARAARRKERKSVNYASKLARRSKGKGSLKSSGDGGKKKGGDR